LRCQRRHGDCDGGGEAQNIGFLKHGVTPFNNGFLGFAFRGARCRSPQDRLFRLLRGSITRPTARSLERMYKPEIGRRANIHAGFRAIAPLLWG
jgi:hypothetical protein